MNWVTVVCLSAAGGAIVSVVAFCGDVFAWQQIRRAAHVKKRAARSKRTQDPLTLREYVDPWPEFAVMITRVALGVIAGALFRSQETTALAAVAVGSSAPALLAQLGAAKPGRDSEDATEAAEEQAEPASNGTGPAAAASIQLAEPEMPGPGG